MIIDLILLFISICCLDSDGLYMFAAVIATIFFQFRFQFNLKQFEVEEDKYIEKLPTEFSRFQ